MAKKQKGKTLWLTNDKGGMCLWEYKEFPQQSDGNGFCSSNGRLLSTTDVLDASDITIAPGERRRVRLVSA